MNRRNVVKGLTEDLSKANAIDYEDLNSNVSDRFKARR